MAKPTITAAPKPLKIAVYAICMNEEKHIERWLQATKGANVRVVADTGSTDNSVTLLEAAGVQVHRISVVPWRFDDARNAALALVPDDVDVCLSLDMDEVPEPLFFMKVRDGWRRNSTRGWIDFDTRNVWKANKLHARHGYRWIHPIHEIAVKCDSTGEKHVYIDALIRHLPDVEKSRSMYLPMLKRAVEETPNDARMWIYLAREHYFHHNWSDVIAAASRAVQLGGWKVETAAACRWAGEACDRLGIEQLDWFQRGVDLLPDEPEPWFGLACSAYQVKDWQLCLDSAAKALSLPTPNHYLCDAEIQKWKAYDLACMSAYHLGDLRAALGFAVMAYEGNPKDDRLRGNVEWLMNESQSHDQDDAVRSGQEHELQGDPVRVH